MKGERREERGVRGGEREREERVREEALSVLLRSLPNRLKCWPNRSHKCTNPSYTKRKMIDAHYT